MRTKLLLALFSVSFVLTTAFSAQATDKLISVNSKSFIDMVLVKKIGETFIVSFPDNRTETCFVQQIKTDNSSITFQGIFINRSKSSFRLEMSSDKVTGLAIFHNENIAYKFYDDNESEEGLIFIQEVALSEVLCVDYAPPSDNVNNQGPTNKSNPESQMVPLYESLPGAIGVLFLDCDGQTVTGTGWNSTYNGGNPIVALSPGLSNGQILDIWSRVAEDFMPFNINVTTDSNVFNAATPGRRMRCIITPTDSWYPSSVGGVAYIGSFTWVSQTPCWVFITSNNKYIAEACSHELGHTLNLTHDGQTPSTTYYLGHGTGNVGWAPIMGAGYYEYVSQWSIGEYTNANNTQNDLTIISNQPNVGYRPDDHTDVTIGATPFIFTGNNVTGNNTGIIELRGDTDVFVFTKTQTFNMNLMFTPAPYGPNLDIRAEIYDASNNLIASSNVALDLYANIILNNQPPGTYYIKVDGVGYATPSTGYTDYASIGAYTITGNVTTIAGAVNITPQSATTFCNGGSVILQASSGFTSYVWTPATGLSATTGQTVTASPTVSTIYTVTTTGITSQAICSVTVNPIPVVSATPTTASYCIGGSVPITASGANTYAWTPATGLSATTGASVTANPTVLTTYTITGTGTGGCTNTTTVTITPNALPTVTASITLSAICFGDSSQLNSVGTGTTYAWLPASNLTCSSCISTFANPATTTNYTVTTTDANGCSATDSVLLTVNPLPNVVFTAPGDVCVNWTAFNLTTATPVGGTYSGTGVSANMFDPSVAGIGTFVLSYSYTDVNSCSNNDTASITVNSCAGINEISASINVRVYPNPFEEVVNIDVSAEAELKICNVLGEEIGNYILLIGNNEISARHLSSGVYFLKITSGGVFITKKIIKE